MSFLIRTMLIIIFRSECLTHLFVICSLSAIMLSVLFSPLLGYSTSPLYSINTVHAEGATPQFEYRIEYFLQTPPSPQSLWPPPLTFGPTTDCRNSALWNPRTSICKGEAHTLKPMSLNLLPSCLVPRLAYAPPLSSTFIGLCRRNRFWHSLADRHRCVEYPAVACHKGFQDSGGEYNILDMWGQLILPNTKVHRCNDSCTLHRWLS